MSTDEYYMNIAFAVREKANCKGRRVGAVLVKDNRIISTGYNGTPEDMPNCLDGGCVRCRDRKQFAPGIGYDVCICVHAEQNALITAARFGIPVQGSVIYSTMRPCFDCSKSLLQAKVQAVYYHEHWPPREEKGIAEQYELLQSYFRDGVHQVPMPDLEPHDYGP